MVIEEVRDISVRQMSADQQSQELQRRMPTPLQDQTQRLEQRELEEAREVSRDKVENAIESLNQSVSLLNHRLRFSIDESTGRLQVRVIDNLTNEIIREVPPERVLAFVRKFEEFLGLLFDERA